LAYLLKHESAIWNIMEDHTGIQGGGGMIGSVGRTLGASDLHTLSRQKNIQKMSPEQIVEHAQQ
jgi:hypothetical protein